MAASIPYTSREFATILSDIRDNLKNSTQTLPNVNDFLESNEGRFLLDQWAAIAEMSNFTLDRSAAEAYIDTLEERASLVSLLKLIGYQPKNPIPEVVNLTISRNDTNTNEIRVPRKTVVTASTNEKIAFATSSVAVLSSSDTSVVVPAVQGNWNQLSISANGQPYFAVVVPSQNIANEYVEVTVDNVIWAKANNNTFVGHSSNDLVYRVINSADRRVLVEFGDGVEGKMPPVGAKVVVRYLVTLGLNGHVNSNTLTSISGTVKDTSGTTVSLAVNNQLPSNGGSDYETIEVSRRRYPEVFKAMRRAVTLGDWEALTLDVGGVLRVNAVDYNKDNSLPFFNVKIYAVGTNGEGSDALNSKIRDALNKSKVNATTFTVASPEKVQVDVKGEIFVYSQYNANEVLTNAIAAVSDFFTMTGDDTSEIKLGVSVPFSKIITAIQNVEGVKSVVLSQPTGDIAVDTYQYASLFTVDLSVGEERN